MKFKSLKNKNIQQLNKIAKRNPYMRQYVESELNSRLMLGLKVKAMVSLAEQLKSKPLTDGDLVVE